MKSKPKGMGLGIVLGAALGILLGVLAGHIALWLGTGVAIGIAIGSTMPRKHLDCPECATVHRQHEVENLSQQVKS